MIAPPDGSPRVRPGQAARPGEAVRRAALILAGGLAIVVTAQALVALITYYPYGVDLEIPLRAARRFAEGGQPYLLSAFEAQPGPDLPFLYPPLTLPFLVPLLGVPRELLFGLWTIFGFACAVFACRRLALPWWAVPIALAWPPFAEALLGGNVQVPLFAAFSAIFWTGEGAPFRPVARDIRLAGPQRATVDGVLATLIGAVKVSQAHSWLFLVRWRPRAALVGAAVVVAVCALTLPAVGIQRWVDWLSQAGRSGDPSWPLVGTPLSIFVGRTVATILTVLSLAAMLLVPMRRAGAWIGLLSIIGAPSLHMFGLLFLVPAMLGIRRDVALVGAMLIATYTTVGVATGTVLIGLAFALSGRVPLLAVDPAPEAWSGIVARGAEPRRPAGSAP